MLIREALEPSTQSPTFVHWNINAARLKKVLPVQCSWPFLLFSRWLWRLSPYHVGVVLKLLCQTLHDVPCDSLDLVFYTISWTYFGSWLTEVESFSQLGMSEYGLAVLNLAGLVGGSMKPGWWFGCFCWLPSGSDENISATEEQVSAIESRISALKHSLSTLPPPHYLVLMTLTTKIFFK